MIRSLAANIHDSHVDNCTLTEITQTASLKEIVLIFCLFMHVEYRTIPLLFNIYTLKKKSDYLQRKSLTRYVWKYKEKQQR